MLGIVWALVVLPRNSLMSRTLYFLERSLYVSNTLSLDNHSLQKNTSLQERLRRCANYVAAQSWQCNSEKTDISYFLLRTGIYDDVPCLWMHLQLRIFMSQCFRALL